MTVQGMKINFNKEIEILKKIQARIKLEIKSSVKNSSSGEVEVENELSGLKDR